MIDGNPDSWESHAINTDNINTDLNKTENIQDNNVVEFLDLKNPDYSLISNKEYSHIIKKLLDNLNNIIMISFIKILKERK